MLSAILTRNPAIPRMVRSQNRIILAVFMFAVSFTYLAHAATVYEKEGNKLKITETSEIVTEQVKSLLELNTEKLRLEEEIVNAAEAYTAKDTKLKAELVIVETNITEAGKLGITEEIQL